MGTWQFLRRGGTGRSAWAALATSFVVAFGGMAASTVAQAGIADTKHNLGSAGTGANKFTGTAEICVFCHTPHGADTSAAVPLWNRQLPAPASFTTYDSLGTSTLDGKTAPVGSVSIACLSCHDGVTSMSAVINAPGSGLSGDANWQAGTWQGPAAGVGGRIGPDTAITNLGTDLKNDHPIGIQYGGGGLTITAPTGTTRDPDFKAPSTQAIGSGATASRIWWVDTEATPSNSRQKTDMMLYTRAATGGYTGQTEAEPFVECASCHDPHTSDNATFLRISNASSAVCLACHVK